MDDFFDGLRNDKNEKQRISKPQKIHANNHQHKNLRSHFNNNNQMPPRQNQNGNRVSMNGVSVSLFQDAIENLCSVIEAMERNQEHLFKAQEKIVDMLESNVVATEKILDHLNI
jgi:hypothetical protein